MRLFISVFFACLFFTSAAFSQMPEQLNLHIIAPVNSKDKNTSELARKIIVDSFRQHKFSLVDHEVFPLKEKLKHDVPLTENHLKDIFSNTIAKRVVVGTLDSTEKNLFVLSFKIYDENLTIIFQKFSQNNIGIAKNLAKLQNWLDEYMTGLSPIGKILKREKETVEISFDKDLINQSMINKHFTVYCRDEKCDNLKNKEVKGVFYQLKKDILLGHLYDNYSFIEENNIPNSSLHVFQTEENKTKPVQHVDITTKDVLNSQSYIYSLRNCVVMPFTGNVGEESLEDFRLTFLEAAIRDGRCVSKTEDDFIEIFQKYEKNLKEYIHNPEVIKIVADKHLAGSMFNVDIQKKMMGTIVTMKVYGQNGADIYFSQQAIIHDYNEKYISSLIYQWLLKYVRELPLDATVIESIDQNVLFDLGKSAIQSDYQHFKILRPIKLTLIREGDSYESKWMIKEIGSGVVKQVNEENTIGYALNTDKMTTNIRKGDWIKLDAYDKLADIKPVFIQHHLKGDRKKAKVKLAGSVASLGSATGKNTKLYSIFLGADMYLPYSWLFTVDSERLSDNLSDSSLQKNNVKLAFGRSKIFEGNLLVSLVDFQVGYMFSFIPASKLEVLGVGDLTYKGPFASMKFEIPVYTKNKIGLGIAGSPLLDVENSKSLLGAGKKTTYYSFFANIDFKLKKRGGLAFFTEFVYDNYNTTFTVDDVNVKFTRMMGRFGITYDF